MAFYDQEDEEQQGAEGGAVATGPQSGVISGQGSGAPSGGVSAPTQSKNAPDKPGNFVGIHDYLKQNKPQAAKLGDQAAGIINTSADQARTSLNTLNQEASEKVKGTAALDEGITQKIGSNAEALSADERALAKKTASAQYQGPRAATDLAGYQAASDASKLASQNIDKSGTEEGRMSLISQINNKPRTQGMNVFDNILLQSGGGREKLGQAAQANQGIKGQLDTAAAGITGQIGRADDPSTPDIDESAGAIGQTIKSQAGASKSIQDAMNAWKSGFTPKVAAAQNDLVGLQNRITGDLGDNQLGLDAETAALFGFNGNDRIFDLDLKNYLNNVSPSDINAGNVASQEDYARYGALADLAGETDMLLNPANASQAGTAPRVSVNRDQLSTDMLAKQANYEKTYNSTKFDQLFPGHPHGYKSLTEIETKTIPELITNGMILGDEAAGNTSRAFAQQMVDALKKFKKEQGYDNVVNPDDPIENLPMKPNGQIDWGRIEAPTGGAGKGGNPGSTPGGILPPKGKGN